MSVYCSERCNHQLGELEGPAYKPCQRKDFRLGMKENGQSLKDFVQRKTGFKQHVRKISLAKICKTSDKIESMEQGQVTQGSD